jgi:hypothetical protein
MTVLPTVESEQEAQDLESLVYALRLTEYSNGAGLRLQGGFLVQTHFGTEYRGQCFFALETEEQGGLNEVGWTCFFAQEIRRTQFYRWLPSLTPGELE